MSSDVFYAKMVKAKKSFCGHPEPIETEKERNMKRILYAPSSRNFMCGWKTSVSGAISYDANFIDI